MPFQLKNIDSVCIYISVCTLLSTILAIVYLIKGSSRGRGCVLACIDKFFGRCICCRLKQPTNVFIMSTSAVSGFYNNHELRRHEQ